MDKLNELIDSFIVFLNSKNYVIVEIGQNKYLVNHVEKYKIFKISINKFVEHVNVEKKMLDDFKLTNSDIIQILLITDEKYRNKDKNILYAINKQEFELIIKSYFLDFTSVDEYNYQKKEDLKVVEKNQKEDQEQDQNEEIIKKLFSKDSPQYEELKNVAIKSQNPPVATKIIATFFSIIPFVFFSLSFILDSLLKLGNYFNDSIVRIGYLGAVDYRLTIISNQYWRVITYGFVPDFSTFLSGTLELFLCCAILYNLIKFSSSVIGYITFTFSIIISYVLTGFVSAIIMQKTLMSGQIFLLAIVAGALTSTLWSKNQSLLKMFSKSRLVPSFIIIILLPLINFQSEKFIMTLFAFGISGICTVLFSTNFKQLDHLSFFTSLIIMVGTILFVVLVIVFRDKTLLTSLNYKIVQILSLQAKSKMISVDQANDILSNKLVYKFEITNDFKIKSINQLIIIKM